MFMPPSASEASAKRSEFEVYANVIRALMLRDMRTRFGGSYWGYVVVLLWPVVHIFVMVGIMVFRGIPSPMGNDAVLFVATGAVPVLVFQYTSREAMKAMLVNRPLMYYPQVKAFDIMVARFLVETIKGFQGLIIIILILLSMGIDPTPAVPALAISGYLMALLLGLGLGAINMAIMTVFPGWLWGYIVITVFLYMTSGVFFLPSFLPEEIYSLMKWSPIVQIVEWVRIAYNPQLGLTVDYTYVLGWAFGSVSLGLLMERVMLRRFV
jgi:capsular polysaccharide transport system permease protein